MGEAPIRFHDRFPFADAIVVRNQHGDLRGKPDGLVEIGVMIVAVELGVVIRKHRGERAQHIHGQHVLGQELQTVEDGGVELAFLGQALLERPEFVGLGQAAIPEQVADFLKGGVVGQVVDVVSTVGEDAPLTVDETNAGCGGDYAFQSFRSMNAGDAGHGSSFGWRIWLRVQKVWRATLFYTPNRREFPNRAPWPVAPAGVYLRVCCMLLESVSFCRIPQISRRNS